MPAALKIRVIGARNLPVMDTASGLTDAYVDLRFAQTSHRSAICYRSLNPVWNQDFRIEVADDCDLQDHPLVLKCWDKDLMSTDDEIGAVCIDLNPLCHDGPTTQISGWFPLSGAARVGVVVPSRCSPSLCRGVFGDLLHHYWELHVSSLLEPRFRLHQHIF